MVPSGTEQISHLTNGSYIEKSDGLPGVCVPTVHANARGGAWLALTTLATAAPAALVAWPNRLMCPCQAQNAKNSSEKGRARSTRGADGRAGRQTQLPAPQLIVAALAHAPIAPIVSLERRGIAIL